MTGPVVPSDEDELREALAAVLSDWRARYGRAVPEADELIAALDRRGVELTRKGHPDCVDAVKFVAEHHHGHDYPRCAADRERYADQRAAEELRAAANEYGLAPSGKPWLPQAYMHTRAAALTARERETGMSPYWRPCCASWGDHAKTCPAAARPAADVTREPTGGQELREAITRALDDTATGLWMGQHGPGWGDVIAGVLLGLPEVAALIADGERVRRVRELLAAADRRAIESSARMFSGEPFPPSIWHDDLRRALDGEDV